MIGKFKVWDPNNGDEDSAKEFEASDVKHAAVRYAEKYDSDSDYRFTEREGVNLLVRKVGSDYVASVVAYGEQTIDYSARLLNERDFE